MGLGEASKDDLVERADHGLQGQGALVEMMSRLQASIETLDKTSGKQQTKMITLTWWIMWLTAVIAIDAALQVVHLFT